jgi:hypothetical protein
MFINVVADRLSALLPRLNFEWDNLNPKIEELILELIPQRATSTYL